MTSRSRARWAAALLAAFAVVQWADGQDRDAAPEPAEAPPPQAVALAPELRLDKLARRTHQEPAGDLFAARSWEALAREEARRNAPPPPPPPKPQAPPLPFAYMGKLVEDGRVTVFLTNGERNWIVRAGDTVEGAYRVDAIEEQAVALTYLPLGIRQTLATGGAP